MTSPLVDMVLIDPLLSLAVSMHAQKDVYAVLLGSGVSRSAQIPTGWEVVLDLASRLAAASGEHCKGESRLVQNQVRRAAGLFTLARRPGRDACLSPAIAARLL